MDFSQSPSIVELYEDSPETDRDALLLKAALVGRVSDVRSLVKDKGVDPMTRDEDGWTVVHWAAYNGRLAVVKCLVDECGMDPQSCRDDKGLTPLHTAAQHGQLEVLRYLLSEKHCDPMLRDDGGCTVLHRASFFGLLTVVKYLTNECAIDPVACQDAKGQTALHAAARGGHVEILTYLLNEKKCDPMTGDEEGWTILHWAANNGHLRVVRFLIDECGLDPESCLDNKGQTPLHRAGQRGQLGVLTYLINDKKCELGCQDKNGETVLHRAADGGHFKALQFLVEECGICNDVKLSGEFFEGLSRRIKEYLKDKVTIEEEKGRDKCSKQRLTPHSKPLPSTEEEKDNTQECLGADDLGKVLEAAWQARIDWYNIGLALRITSDTLDVIKSENHHVINDCFRETLKAWLASEPSPTWTELVKALSSRIVGHQKLAEELKHRLVRTHSL